VFLETYYQSRDVVVEWFFESFPGCIMIEPSDSAYLLIERDLIGLEPVLITLSVKLTLVYDTDKSIVKQKTFSFWIKS
jgi:hypothetical protein